jgi:hydrogenase-4 membrane subunit HyfE
VTFELALLLAGAVLILSPRTLLAAAAYVVIASIATASILPAAVGSPFALALLSGSAFLKLVVAPIGIYLFIRANPTTRDLRPSISLPIRLVVVVVIGLAARSVSGFVAFQDVAGIGVTAFVVLCALGMLVVQRNLIAHIIGLLAFSAGITLAGSAIVPGLPESVELGASFDALVVTFIGLAIVRAFLAQNPLLDVASLRNLRG